MTREQKLEAALREIVAVHNTARCADGACRGDGTLHGYFCMLGIAQRALAQPGAAEEKCAACCGRGGFMMDCRKCNGTGTTGGKT